VSDRIAKVNSLIQHELAASLTTELEAKDYLITVIGVDTSPDLRHCNVWITVMPEKFNGTALEQLRKASHGINEKLRGRLKMKFVPKLVFKIDTQEAEARDVEALLDRLGRDEEK